MIQYYELLLHYTRSWPEERVFDLIKEAKEYILEKGGELLVTQVHAIASLALIYDVPEDIQPLAPPPPPPRTLEECWGSNNQKARKDNKENEEEKEEEEEEEEEEDEKQDNKKRKGNAIELEQSGSNTETNPERPGEEQMEED